MRERKSEKARKRERLSERKSDAHTHIHTHTHTHTHKHTHAILAPLLKSTHTRAHTHLRTQGHTETLTYVHMCAWACAYVRAPKNTHTHTRTCTHTMQIHACAHANVTNQMKLRQLLTMLQLPCAKKPRFPILIPQFTPLHRCKVSEL